MRKLYACLMAVGFAVLPGVAFARDPLHLQTPAAAPEIHADSALAAVATLVCVALIVREILNRSRISA